MAAIPILFASFFSALFSPRVWLTLWLALLASLVMVAGLYFHWRAYRPLCQPQEDPS